MALLPYLRCRCLIDGPRHPGVDQGFPCWTRAGRFPSCAAAPSHLPGTRHCCCASRSSFRLRVPQAPARRSDRRVHRSWTGCCRRRCCRRRLPWWAETRQRCFEDCSTKKSWRFLSEAGTSAARRSKAAQRDLTESIARRCRRSSSPMWVCKSSRAPGSLATNRRAAFQYCTAARDHASSAPETPRPGERRIPPPGGTLPDAPLGLSGERVAHVCSLPPASPPSQETMQVLSKRILGLILRKVIKKALRSGNAGFKTCKQGHEMQQQPSLQQAACLT